MKQQTKVVLWTVGAVAAAFAAYKAYKYYKEEKELEASELDINDIRKYHDSKKMEDIIDARVEYLREEGEDLDDIDYGESDSDEEDEKLIFMMSEDGVEYRTLSREEAIYGADYNHLEEELVDMVIDGSPVRVIRKREEPILANNQEKRSLGDIIESVEDMASQIRSLKNVDMEYEERIYEPNTMDAYDYYIALLLDRNEITDENDRKVLIMLSSYEFLYDINDLVAGNMKENLQGERYEHLGISDHNRWVSDTEVLLYCANKLNFNVDTLSVPDIIHMMIEYMGIDYDDDDIIVNDVIMSFMGHDRYGKPNYDNTYGLFGITEAQYAEANTMLEELNFSIENNTRLLS